MEHDETCVAAEFAFPDALWRACALHTIEAVRRETLVVAYVAVGDGHPARHMVDEDLRDA